MNDDPVIYAPDGKPMKKVEPQRQPFSLNRFKTWAKAAAKASLTVVTTTATTTILLVILWWNYFGGKDFIEQRVRHYTYDKLTEPYIRDVVTEVASSNAQVVASIVARTNAEIVAISNAQAVASRTGSNVQEFVDAALQKLTGQVDIQVARLSNAQMRVEERVDVQDLQVRAKGGSFAAYEQLKRLKNNVATAESAGAAEVEVGFFFENWVRQGTHYYITDTVSKLPVEVTVEETVGRLLESETSARMIAAYSIRRFGKKNTVQSLVQALSIETNLFALCQMVRSLNELTGNRIHILDRPAMLEWWSTSKEDTNFHSAYDGFCKFGAGRVFSSDIKVEEILSWMSHTIDNEPDALKARCIRGHYLNVINERGRSDADFAEVEKRSPNFGYLHFYRGWTLLDRGEIDSAVLLLNRAFETRPSLANIVRPLIPLAVATNTLLRWPTNVARLESLPK